MYFISKTYLPESKAESKSQTCPSSMRIMQEKNNYYTIRVQQINAETQKQESHLHECKDGFLALK